MFSQSMSGLFSESSVTQVLGKISLGQQTGWFEAAAAGVGSVRIYFERGQVVAPDGLDAVAEVVGRLRRSPEGSFRFRPDAAGQVDGPAYEVSDVIGHAALLDRPTTAPPLAARLLDPSAPPPAVTAPEARDTLLPAAARLLDTGPRHTLPPLDLRTPAAAPTPPPVPTRPTVPAAAVTPDNPVTRPAASAPDGRLSLSSIVRPTEQGLQARPQLDLAQAETLEALGQGCAPRLVARRLGIPAEEALARVVGLIDAGFAEMASVDLTESERDRFIRTTLSTDYTRL